LGLTPASALSALLAALAALLAARPLARVVLAHASCHVPAVLLSTAAIVIIGVLYTKLDTMETRLSGQIRGVDAKLVNMEATLSAELREVAACVRDGMRRVDAFAEAGAKAQLTWDAVQLKLVPAAVAQRR
jgi:hypothetical protein